MIKILFSGNNSLEYELSEALKGSAYLVRSGSADLHFQSFESKEDFSPSATESNIPIFIIVNADKFQEAAETLKSFNCKYSGVIPYPFQRDTILKKVESISAFVGKKDPGDELKIKILSKAENMPALPILASKIIGVLTNRDTDFDEIIELIKKDQVVSGRVIRMVNSPFYGLRNNIASIDRAAVYLGFSTVKNIALAASTDFYYQGISFEKYKITGYDLWKHAYISAILSELIANYKHIDTDVAFLAGLLHDVGKTILAGFLKSPVSSPEEEKLQIGIDHASAAGIFLRKWQIPQDVIEAVVNHHTLNVEKPFSAIVYYASALANSTIVNIDKTISELCNDLQIHDIDSISKEIKNIVLTGVDF